MIPERIASSFRDPSGYVYSYEGAIFRQVNWRYQEDYDFLMQSGLYEALVKAGLLVSHEEVAVSSKDPRGAYKILKPEEIPFISYPYEWSFSQLKNAGMTLLQIQKIAIDHGMSLKDCSAYNIQYRGNRPVLIDTLSFEKLRDGRPWVAYRQFCQHFLAPIALMSYVDIRLGQMLRIYIDGIPLDLSASLLPLMYRIRPSLYLHIFLHAKYQTHGSKHIGSHHHSMGRLALRGLIDSLECAIQNIKWVPKRTEWIDYYESCLSSDVLEYKKGIVADCVDRLEFKAKNLWDLGSNTGIFSRIASEKGIYTVSADNDPACVERNYLQSVKNGENDILPLVVDLTNPSPDIGWANAERLSLQARGPADVALALALIHHLAISNNIPLDTIANFFAKICRALIIEFVPKSDPKVVQMLANREDIFDNYTKKAFEEVFQSYFQIQHEMPLKGTDRVIYLMKRR